MNWPSMEKLRLALVACGLVVAGCCCVAACNSTPTGGQAQAKPEEWGPRETADAAPLAEEDVLAFLESERFEAAGVRLGFNDSMGGSDGTPDKLQVRFVDGDVWVFEACREGREARALREDRLAGALISQFNIPEGACDTSMLPFLHVIDSLSSKIAAALEGRLTDARLCALAVHLSGHTLEDGEDAHGPAGQQDLAELAELLKTDAVRKSGFMENRSVPLHQGGDAKRLHWVVMDANDLRLENASNEESLAKAIKEQMLAATGKDVSPADVIAKTNGEDAKAEGTGRKQASDAIRETGSTDRPEAPADSGAPSSPSGGNEGSGKEPETDKPATPRPSSPGSIEVVEQPSDGGDRPDGSADGTPASPEKPHEGIWVVDKAAWDERVLTTPAWDEQVWVEKLEWVPDNVWVVDQAAWDEQVVAQEGYYESIPTTTHYRFFADGYVTYDDDDMLAHLKELLAQDLPTNYCVEWEYEQVWHEPEYSTVHHDEVGHWEDRGSYQDKGHYQTVRHEAQYTTVHHDEEGHWE